MYIHLPDLRWINDDKKRVIKQNIKHLSIFETKEASLLIRILEMRLQGYDVFKNELHKNNLREEDFYKKSKEYVLDLKSYVYKKFYPELKNYKDTYLMYASELESLKESFADTKRLLYLITTIEMPYYAILNKNLRIVRRFNKDILPTKKDSEEVYKILEKQVEALRKEKFKRFKTLYKKQKNVPKNTSTLKVFAIACFMAVSVSVGVAQNSAKDTVQTEQTQVWGYKSVLYKTAMDIGDTKVIAYMKSLSEDELQRAVLDFKQVKSFFESKGLYKTKEWGFFYYMRGRMNFGVDDVNKLKEYSFVFLKSQYTIQKENFYYFEYYPEVIKKINMVNEFLDKSYINKLNPYMFIHIANPLFENVVRQLSYNFSSNQIFNDVGFFIETYKKDHTIFSKVKKVLEMFSNDTIIITDIRTFNGIYKFSQQEIMEIFEWAIKRFNLDYIKGDELNMIFKKIDYNQTDIDLAYSKKVLRKLNRQGYEYRNLSDMFNIIINAKNIYDHELYDLILDYDLTNMDRFYLKDLKALQKLSETSNKKHFMTGKRTSLMFFAKADYQNAAGVHKMQLQEYLKHFDIELYEIQNTNEMVEILQKYPKNSIDMVMTFGHGNTDLVTLGFQDMDSFLKAKTGELDKKRYLKKYDAKYLDFSDEYEVKQLQRVLKDTSHIVLLSCLTGKNGEHGINMMNFIKRVFDTTTIKVTAPKQTIQGVELKVKNGEIIYLFQN